MSQTPSARMFPTTATIQSATLSQDEEGGIIETWGDSFADVPCQFSSFSPGSSRSSEVQASAAFFVNAQYRAILLGDLAITTRDRCVCMGQTFDIRGVERDSFALVTTLHLEGTT